MTTLTAAAMVTNALSPDESIRVPAENALQAAEKQPGFIECLLNLCLSREQETPARVLASILVKNAVGRHWRKRRGSSATTVSEYEKSRVRELLLTRALVEPQALVATQLALVTSKIARFDWPAEWPALFDRLASHCGPEADALALRRTVAVLYRTVKELSSKRLLSDRRSFQALAQRLFPGSRALWAAHAQGTIGHLERLVALQAGPVHATDASELVAACAVHAELCMRCCKVLRLLVVYGAIELDGLDGVEDFFREAAELLAVFSSLRPLAHSLPVFQGAVSIACSVDKSLRALAGTIVDVQREKPLAFVPFLSMHMESFLQAVMAFNGTNVDNHHEDAKEVTAQRYEPLIVLSLSFLSNAIGCREYRPAPDASAERMITSQGDVRPKGMKSAEGGWRVILSLLSSTRISELVRMLVIRMLRLTNRDLHDWETDPEGYLVAQESLTRNESVRPAAEHLLMTLVDSHRDVVLPLLVNMITESEAACSSQSFIEFAADYELRQLAQSDTSNDSISIAALCEPLLLRESVYLACGLAAFQLHDAMGNRFECWMTQTLLPQLVSPRDPRIQETMSCRVMQRRILWLMGCWVSEISPNGRTALYGHIVEMLSGRRRTTSAGDHSRNIVDSNSPANGYLVVRLAAVSTLRALIEDWDFSSTSFELFLSDTVSAVFLLIRACETCDSKLALLELLSCIVNRMGRSMMPHLEAMLCSFPWLWESSGGIEHNLIRISLLRLIHQLVDAVGLQNDMCTTALLPIINPLLAYATDPFHPDHVYLGGEAIQLWLVTIQHTGTYTPELHALYPRIPHLLEQNMDCLKNYLQLSESYVLLGGDKLMVDHSSAAVKTFELIVGKVKPRGAIYLCRAVETTIRRFPDFPSLLENVLIIMFKACIIADDVSKIDAASPSMKNKVEPDLVLVGYLTILARGYLHCEKSIFVMLEMVGKEMVVDAKQLFLRLVDIWLDKFDAVGHSAAGPWRRKLWSLVLCKALHDLKPDMVPKLPQIVHVCADVLTELDGSGASDAAERYLPEEVSDEVGDQEHARRRDVFLRDDVYTSDLRTIIIGMLRHVEGLIGLDSMQSAVDQSTWNVLNGQQM